MIAFGIILLASCVLLVIGGVLALKGKDYWDVLFVAFALIFGCIMALERISETNPDLLRIESITDVGPKDCKC